MTPGFSRRQLLALAAAPFRIPRMQAVPEPYDQVSFQRDSQEIARFHYGKSLRRPFVYPIASPSGRTLTRMGHPGDPYGHSHHNSVWISYSDVNGVDFWSDRGKNCGTIAVDRVVDLFDEEDRAGVLSEGVWKAADGRSILSEKRETWAYPLEGKEWLLVLDLTLDAVNSKAVFAQSGFGPIGVRVSKWISEHFGNGRLRNSEGGQGEPAIFRKPARWTDCSGTVMAQAEEGIALFDHPMNPSHPSPFHVRADGWMGAMLSTKQAVEITPGHPLHLRYGVYSHAGIPDISSIDRMWTRFARLDLHPPFGPPTAERDCLHGGHRRFNRPRAFRSAKDCIDFVAK
ncbi:MAG: PmoA family protein [Proteobacteria bacterium]|nr:PmoA family protein [Pseudomonadota bacterium]